MRDDTIRSFLDATLKPGWTMSLLAGDASRRRYMRVTLADGGSRILMDADPSTGEEIGPFLQIAEHLIALDLSAPRIDAVDAEHGLILMEDLGDALLSREVRDAPNQELDLYRASADVLWRLHSAPPPPGIPVYGPDQMAELGGLAMTWYADSDDVAALTAPLLKVLEDCQDPTSVLVLRDYHAENLISLPNRAGLRRIGLLDFQDAALGHPSYDLASLLRDARRDVSPACQEAILSDFAQRGPWDADQFTRGYAAQSAQRNLRILGVFARLCLRDGKPNYLRFVPRVWRHLTEDLSHPDLRDLAYAVRACLPEPTPEFLTKLQSRCATAPVPL